MNAILTALLEVTVASAVIYGAILLFLRLFKGKLSARFQYFIWFLLVLRLLMPVTVESGLHLPFPGLSAPAQANVVLPDVGGAGAQYAPPDTQSDADGYNGVNVAVNAPAVDTADNAPSQAAAVAAPLPAPAAQTPAQPSPAGSAGWAMVLLAVWLAGALVSAVRFAAMGSKLRRQSIHERGLVPAPLRIMVAECKAQLGIRSKILIVMQKSIRTPALSVSFQPRIFFSAERELNERAIRFAVLHELTHWKHRDPWVCLLLNALRCVYWFNPVAWLLACRMRMDMETACDAAVVRSMGSNEKKQYAEVVLSMFANNARSSGLALGMAMENNRATAECRIRGVFMRSRTPKPVRALAAVLAMALLFACFTTGCIPAPAKAADAPTASAQQTASPQPPATADAQASAQPTATPESTESPVSKFPAPATVQDSFPNQDGKVQIVVDASVSIPNAEQYPVLNLEPADISIDNVKAAAAALMPGMDLFEPAYLTMTKQQIRDEIAQLQFDLANPEKSTADGMHVKDKNGVPADVPLFTRRVKYLQGLLATAPDVYVKKPAAFAFKTAFDYQIPDLAGDYDTGFAPDRKYMAQLKNSREIILVGYFNGGFVGTLTATNELVNTTRSNNLRYEKKIPRTRGESPDPDFPALTISTEDALAKARGTLHAMGLDDAALSNISMSADKYLILGKGVKAALAQGRSLTPAEILAGAQMLTQTGKESANGAKPKSYELNFTRTYCGVPATGPSVSVQLKGSQRKAAPCYNDEKISLTVDNGGVSGFTWENPLKVTSVVTQNAQMLPFDQVMGIFKEEMSKQYSLAKISHYATENPDYKKVMSNLDKGMIKITGITLGLVRTNDQAHPGKYILVPAWNFYGADAVMGKKSPYTLDQLLEQSMQPEELRQYSYLTINALDGSLIVVQY